MQFPTEPGLQHSLHNEEPSVDPFAPVAGNILPRFSSNEQNHVPEYTDTNMGDAGKAMLIICQFYISNLTKLAHEVVGPSLNRVLVVTMARVKWLFYI